MTMPVKVGVIGCGLVSEVYLRNLQNVFHSTTVTAVADPRLERAQSRATEFSVPVAVGSASELVERDDVDLVVNLTSPDLHFEVSKAALLAGKHVYSEKPLALSIDDARTLGRLAGEQNLYLASAPDTVLGEAIQTARHVIDAGWIGAPFGFVGHMLWAGPAGWHPSPEFLYQPGAGPILDTAPYTVAALVYLLDASVRQITTFGSRPFESLVVGSGPKAGRRFDVGLDTFVASAVRFDGGVAGSLVHSMSVPRLAPG